jgi:endonuclease YncB( thermonuclease family)
MFNQLTFLMIVSIYSGFLFSQDLKIVKIIDTNIFELETGRKVKFYGLFIPSINDSNATLAKIGQSAFEWEKHHMLHLTFKIQFIGDTSSKIVNAIIRKDYTIGDSDLAEDLLLYGYACLTNDINKEYYDVLHEFQEKSKDRNNTIWRIERIKNMTEAIVIQTDKKAYIPPQYEHPYRFMLTISALSCVFAWDNFASASDIQNSIDLQKKTNKNFNSSDLEEQRTRKVIVGITGLAIGIVATIISFTSVEIKTTSNSIGLSFHF